MTKGDWEIAGNCLGALMGFCLVTGMWVAQIAVVCYIVKWILF